MIRTLSLLAFGLLITGLALLVFILPTPGPSTERASGEEPPGEATAMSPGASTAVLIREVRVFDGNRLSPPLDLLLDQGRIKAMGEVPDSPGASVIDGRGLVALPGLIDSHTHSYGSALRDALRFGVTTQVDMFSPVAALAPAAAARERLVATEEADLFSAGMLATSPGGHGTQYGVPVTPLTDPGQAGDWVRARRAEGSSFIKLVYAPERQNLGGLDRETARAVIHAAHEAGLMVVAHISSHDGAAHMVEDGIDGLVHIFGDREASDALVAAVTANEVFIIPTLPVIASAGGARVALDGLEAEHRERLSPMQSQTLDAGFGAVIPGYHLAIAMDNVRRFHEAGVTILAGSDAPNPGTAYGVSLHQELQLLVEAGLEPTAALRAATEDPARVFGLDGRGVLEAGARADLLLLGGDPTQAVEQSLNLVRLFKNGHEVSLQPGKPAPGTALVAPMLGDFETGLDAPDGFAWSATDDGMMNGASTASLERVAGGAEGSSHGLRVEATVRAGFPYPWAGAMVGSGALQGDGGTDLTGYTSLRFEARGSPGTYRLMAFTADATGIPPTVPFEIGEDWRTVEVRLASLEGMSWERFAGFAFVAGPAAGESTLILDNVRLVE